MDQQKDSGLFWTTEMDTAFLELLIKYSRNGGKYGTKFKKEAWDDMLVGFNRRMSLKITAAKLKNRKKNYLQKYNFLKNNPAASSSKKTMPTLQQLEIIFGNTKDMGSSAPYVDGQEDLEEVSNEGKDQIKVTKVPKSCLESEDDPKQASTVFDQQKRTSGAGEEHRYQSKLCLESKSDPNYSVREFENSVPSEIVVVGQRKTGQTFSGSTSKEAGEEHRYQSNGVEAVVSSPSERKASGAGLTGTERRLSQCMAELNAIEGIDDDLYVKALLVLKDERNVCIFLNTGGLRRLAWLRAVTRRVEI